MPVITNRRIDFKDLDLDFIKHPTTGDIVRKIGPDAIKRSVRNLIFTNFYDRKFRSAIGCNARKILFDNINPFTAIFLQDAIREVITNFEPRVELVPFTPDMSDDVVVHPDPDHNGYVAKIHYIIRNSGQPQTINLFLERIR